MQQSVFPDEQKDGIPVSPTLLDIESTIPENVVYPVNKRVFFLSLQAVINAIIIGFIAKLLVWLIALITNISFFGTLSLEESIPAENNLGAYVIIVPIIGALIVGVMARFGSAAIRGHGIPEAMEQILVNESKIKPIITFLKPISAAISIGTGGPFGAEGPIIATGGAFGSVAGQIMRISATERKILLAAGATAGMSAIFGTPIAGVLLAIELLLFEFSPRSIIPVALACATGAAMHFTLFGTEAVFAMATIPEPSSMAMVWYVIMGVILGIAASLVSKAVYLVEDLFEHLPIHWMWWPALGAVVVGIVGYFAPATLGVGYNNITNLLSGKLPIIVVLNLCFLKFISWVFSLGSGTSGGTLAPLLTIGGAMGALLGVTIMFLFPNSPINLPTCALIGMAAMFAGASRALLTSIVFAMETTMQPHGLLPLLGACTASYFISFFLMKGSIMTEKIQRRGVPTPDVYEPDILQRVSAQHVMNCEPEVLSSENTVKDAREWIKNKAAGQGDVMAFIIVDEHGHLRGIADRTNIFSKEHPDSSSINIVMRKKLLFAYPDTTLNYVVDMIARNNLGLLPIIDRQHKAVVGTISHKEIFKAYHLRHKEEELRRHISLRQQGTRIILKGKQLLDNN